MPQQVSGATLLCFKSNFRSLAAKASKHAAFACYIGLCTSAGLMLLKPSLTCVSDVYE